MAEKGAPIPAASRMADVTYAIRDVVVEAQKVEASGKKIYYLNIGDPLKFDFQTPEHLWEAVFANKEEGESYALANGITEAREAIAAYHTSQGHHNLTAEDIVLGNGGSECIQMALGALVEQEQNVLLPSPGYPVYTAVASFLGFGQNTYYADEENGWQPDVSEMEKLVNEKTRAMVVISPNNPTGAVYSKQTLKELVNLAGQHNLVVFSDEIYYEMILEGEPAVSMASLADDVPIYTFSGLSKNYLATGWRVGWVAANRVIADSPAFEGVNQLARSRLCSVHPFQFAVKPALEGSKDHVHETNAKLKKRNDLFYKRITEMEGVSLTKPKGAFYAFVRIDQEVESDKQFVLDLLRETGVCVVHGSGFGQKPGTSHFRCVILPQEEVLGDALDKLEGFLKARRG